MDKKFLIIFALIIISSSIYSLSKEDIIYPVSELGNCASETDCRTYCDNNANIEVCLTFGEKYGLMSQAEIEEAKKVIKFILDGTTPGGCKSKQECDNYCEKEENLNECIDFALKAGFIPPEEAEMAKKTGGKGPGGCKRDECKTYCDDESHMIECIDFAYEHGMMSEEEYDMAKKTGGKGPGGCKSKEECDTYCNNPDNQETCMNFGIEHGLIPPEDLEKMKKNQEFMNSAEGKCTMQCLKDAGVDSKACGENGAGPEACKTCGDKCFSNNNGKCLSQERWQQLNQDCTNKGGGYHLEEVRGSDGHGGECVIDETCVYSSDKMWESQEEKDRQLAEMQKQWDEDRARYETEHGPGSSIEGDSGGSGEGCTQPGPDGQCNPGPGAGSEGGQSGSDSGSSTSSDGSSSSSDSSGTGGTTPGSEGSGSSSSSGETSSSDAGSSGMTGGAISNSENQNSILVNIYNFLKEIFS